jgi:hypothetical protein
MLKKTADDFPKNKGPTREHIHFISSLDVSYNMLKRMVWRDYQLGRIGK